MLYEVERAAMVEQTVAFEIVVQLFVLGAFLFFLACSLATVVMMVHLGGMPEQRASQPETSSSASVLLQQT